MRRRIGGSSIRYGVVGWGLCRLRSSRVVGMLYLRRLRKRLLLRCLVGILESHEHTAGEKTDSERRTKKNRKTRKTKPKGDFTSRDW